MSDLQIKVTTPADQTGLNQTAQNLTATQRHAAALTRQFQELQEVQKKVATSSNEVNEALQAHARALNSELKANSESGEAVNLALSRAALAAAALAAATAGISKSVEEFASFEQNVTTLDAALARNGQLTNNYREFLQGLAGELETATNVADEQWLAVLTRLVQFGSTPQSIGMDAEAVKNLAGIVGDVSTAAQIYSRALQGNYEMFGRYGIRVGEAGSQTEKLAKLQERLAEIGGGQLEARTNSLNGTFGKLNVQFGNTLQGLGAVIDKTMALRGVIGMLTDALDYWNDFLPDTVDKVSGLENAAGEAAEAFSELGNTDPFAKTKQGASEAKQEVDALIDSMEAAQRRSLAEQDAKLKEDLARIDLQQAEAPDTPQNRIQFKTARSLAQQAAETRRANAEFFGAGEQIRALESRLPGLSGEERTKADEELANLRTRRDVALSGVRAGTVSQFATHRNAQRDQMELDVKEGRRTEMGPLPAFGPQFDMRVQQAHERGVRELVERIERMYGPLQQRVDALSRNAALNQQNIR